LRRQWLLCAGNVQEKHIMRLIRSFPLYGSLFVLTSALLCAAMAMAQAVAPAVRIVDRIDENNLVTLKGNTHPLANAQNDRGRVSPDLPMTDLILVLSRDAAQQAAFDRFVASQYDPDSPNFHHWLTPQQVGADFGPSEIDIATISGWLTGHGFSIGAVSRDGMTIRFSGTAAQVESAFHTEIHNLEVKGVQHIGNMSDPQIPAALEPVVVGVKSLHNFFPRPQHRLGSKVTRDSATGKWRRAAGVPYDSALNTAARPDFGISVPASGNYSAYLVEDVAPYDFAAIYNILPLWNAGTPIDGTGQTIAIAGTSDIDVGQSGETGVNGNNDISTFRTTFGLPTGNAANTPIRVSGNSQPLTVCTSTSSTAQCGIDDLIENTLDVEWAGAVAKNAQIELVASYPASSSDDTLYDSESYIVNTSPLIAKIMNVSYGGCELYLGTAGNVLYYDLWQTASTEGIAVFVAAGDAGSADCDTDGDVVGNPYSAQYGLSVSGLASTPFNTAVGGTDFNWCALPSATQTTECTASPYWNSTNATNGSSAIGYVPEVPWNSTCANPLTVGFLEKWADSSYAGSVGGVNDPESACNFVYNYWQTVQTNTGGSGSGVDLAYLIDTVGGGGGASGCIVNNGSNVSSCLASTTTTGSGNGSILLVSDGWPKPKWQTGVVGIPDDGVRDLPDVSFFSSNGFLSSAYLICVSQVATCTYPTTSVTDGLEVGGTSVASTAMAGVMALIDQKAGSAQGSPNAELYSLAAKQTYSSCSAESVKASSTSCYFNDIDTNTNAMPCDYGATEGNPSAPGIQSPNCSVIHSGDLIGILPGYSAGEGYDQATGLGSLNVANLVNAWSTTLATGTATVTVTPTPASLSASTALSVAVTVASSPSGGTTPTGTVTLSGGGYTSATETLSTGAYTFTVPANSLTAGSDVLTVSYSGDTNYAPASGTTTVTVTASTTPTGTFTVSAAAASPSSVSPGNTSTSTVTVSSTNGYAGTVTLTCALTTSPSNASNVPTCSGGSATVTLSPTATTGTASVTVSTTAPSSSAFTTPGPGKGKGWAGAGGGAVLAFLIFLGIPARRRIWRSMLGAVALMAVLGGMAGCGDFWKAPNTGTSNTGGTTAGTYTFTVTGTGDPAVTPAPTSTFTVTVT
jgi:hypothetical protein